MDPSFNQEQKEYQKSLKTLVGAIRSNTRAVNYMNKNMSILTGKEVNPSTGRITKTVLSNKTQTLPKSIENLQNSVDDLSEQQSDDKQSTEDLSNSINKNTEDLSDSIDSMTYEINSLRDENEVGRSLISKVAHSVEVGAEITGKATLGLADIVASNMELPSVYDPRSDLENLKENLKKSASLMMGGPIGGYLTSMVGGVLKDVVHGIRQTNIFSNRGETYEDVSPTIPEFASGGIIPGRVGESKIIKAHSGEVVLPIHQELPQDMIIEDKHQNEEKQTIQDLQNIKYSYPNSYMPTTELNILPNYMYSNSNDPMTNLISKLDEMIILQRQTVSSLDYNVSYELLHIADILNYGNNIFRWIMNPIQSAVDDVLKGMHKLEFSMRGFIVGLPSFLVKDVIFKAIGKDILWETVAKNFLGKIVLRGMMWEGLLQPLLRYIGTSFKSPGNILAPTALGLGGSYVGGTAAGALGGTASMLGPAGLVGGGLGMLGGKMIVDYFQGQVDVQQSQFEELQKIAANTKATVIAIGGIPFQDPGFLKLMLQRSGFQSPIINLMASAGRNLIIKPMQSMAEAFFELEKENPDKTPKTAMINLLPVLDDIQNISVDSLNAIEHIKAISFLSYSELCNMNKMSEIDNLHQLEQNDILSQIKDAIFMSVELQSQMINSLQHPMTAVPSTDVTTNTPTNHMSSLINLNVRQLLTLMEMKDTLHNIDNEMLNQQTYYKDPHNVYNSNSKSQMDALNLLASMQNTSNEYQKRRTEIDEEQLKLQKKIEKQAKREKIWQQLFSPAGVTSLLTAPISSIMPVVTLIAAASAASLYGIYTGKITPKGISSSMLGGMQWVGKSLTGETGQSDMTENAAGAAATYATGLGFALGGIPGAAAGAAASYTGKKLGEGLGTWWAGGTKPKAVDLNITERALTVTGREYLYNPYDFGYYSVLPDPKTGKKFYIQQDYMNEYVQKGYAIIKTEGKDKIAYVDFQNATTRAQKLKETTEANKLSIQTQRQELFYKELQRSNMKPGQTDILDTTTNMVELPSGKTMSKDVYDKLYEGMYTDVTKQYSDMVTSMTETQDNLNELNNSVMETVNTYGDKANDLVSSAVSSAKNLANNVKNKLGDIKQELLPDFEKNLNSKKGEGGVKGNLNSGVVTEMNFPGFSKNAKETSGFVWEKAKELLKSHENLELSKYQDSEGNWTIGYGHLIKPGENLDTITEERADALFDQDYQTHFEEAKKIPGFENFDEVRQSALVNMVYNMGLSGVLKFDNTLDALRQGNYQTAYMNILQSKYAQQVGSRATQIASLLRSGSEEVLDATLAKYGKSVPSMRVGGIIPGEIDEATPIIAHGGEVVIPNRVWSGFISGLEKAGIVKGVATTEVEYPVYNKEKLINQSVDDKLQQSTIIAETILENGELVGKAFEKISNVTRETLTSVGNSMNTALMNNINAPNVVLSQQGSPKVNVSNVSGSSGYGDSLLELDFVDRIARGLLNP